MKYNEILRKERKKRNIKVKDLAEVLNIKEDTYYKYEQGKNEPDLDTMIKLADYYNVSMDYISGRYEDKRNKDT